MALPATPLRYFTKDLDSFALPSETRLVIVSADGRCLNCGVECMGWFESLIKPADQYLLGRGWREIKPPFISGRAIADLEADVKEKTREIEKLRAENDQLNSEILILERKLSYQLAKTPREGVTLGCPLEPKDLCFQTTV